jgi:hypothetical protein
MTTLPFSQINLTATASVRCHRFVKMTGENTGTECGTQGEQSVGITPGFTDRFPSDVTYPGTPADTVANGAPLVAVTGRGLPYFGIVGQICEVVAGASIAAGDLLMTSNAGAALVATSTNYVRAKALRAASSGELVPVIIVEQFKQS